MTRDPIIEEVHSARQKVMEACNEDLDTLLHRLQEQQKQDRERLLSDLSTQPQRGRTRSDRIRPEWPDVRETHGSAYHSWKRLTE